MNKNEKADIRKETYMGTIPILKSERIYSFPDLLLAAAGFGIASWCYVQGAWISSSIDFTTALIVCVFPLLLSSIIVMSLTIIPARYGVDCWMYQKAVFGHRLAFFLCIAALLLTWGWYAINCGVFAEAIVNLGTLSGLDIYKYKQIFSVICALLGLLLAMRGPYLVKIATYIMVPALIFTGIVLLVNIFSMTDLAELKSYTPISSSNYPSNKIAFLCLTEGMIAFAFAWYPALGGLARLAKTEKSAYWGHLLGYGAAMFVFIIIGCLCGTLVSGRFGYFTNNPSDWFALLCSPGWAIIAIITIALANISTQMMGVYCLSIALKVFKPTWSYKWIAIGMSLFCIILILWDGIWTYYNVFLSAVSISATPACGIIFVDFFLLRKDKFSLRSCFNRDDKYCYTHGLNIWALMSLIIGIVTYILIYNPLTYEIHNQILMKFTPTITSFITGGLSYYLLSRIPAINKYLLK